MATRKETSHRRQALHDELRFACRDGSLPPGEPLPSVRDLAGRYSVSHRLVNEALRTLMDEGLLYSVPRQGTFVGSPNQARDALFLLYSANAVASNDQLSRLQYGFEEQITRLGGTCLTLNQKIARQTISPENPLNPAGVFFLEHPSVTDWLLFHNSCARACFVPHNSGGASALAEPGVYPVVLEQLGEMDTVNFDNVGAGTRITQYLVGQGHTNIAFLGLHSSRVATGAFGWSRERCLGWEKGLKKAGIAHRNLIFLPEEMPASPLTINQQIEVGYAVAEKLLGSIRAREISAVVAVNVHAAQGFFQKLHASDLEPSEWPVTTTFGMGDSRFSMMTTMLLPWEQMGKEAADLLWSRSRGAYQGTKRHVLVPMSLVTRLTCRPNWKARPEAALFALDPILL